VIWLFLALVVVALVAFIVLRGRTGREESGLHSFRRHIDALSPEARRGVIDRVRPPQDPRPDSDQGN
jgi:hypothetical protein